MNAQQIKDRFQHHVDNYEMNFPPSAKAHGVYVGILNRVCKGDANRKLVLKFLTGKTSTKILTDNEWVAVKKMCDISPVELEKVVGIILGEVVKQDGQLSLLQDLADHG
jgi:hypothetical protein